MTMNEKLNAVTRFSIYLSIILYIYNKDSKSLLIAIFVMGLVFFIYNGDNQYKEHFIIDILSPDSEIIVSNDDNCHLENDINQDRLCEKTCTSSTIDNPFMNVLLNEYVENPNRPEACKSFNDESVKEDIRDNFNFNLYKDVSDVLAILRYYISIRFEA